MKTPPATIPAERILATTPNERAAATLAADLARIGIRGPGVEVLVLPVAGTNTSQAIITFRLLDSSSDVENQDPQAIWRSLATSAATRDARIDRFTIDIREPNRGIPALLISIPADAVSRAAAGTLTAEQLLLRSIIQVNRAAFPTAVPGKVPTAAPRVPTAAPKVTTPTAVPKK